MLLLSIIATTLLYSHTLHSMTNLLQAPVFSLTDTERAIVHTVQHLPHNCDKVLSELSILLDNDEITKQYLPNCTSMHRVFPTNSLLQSQKHCISYWTSEVEGKITVPFAHIVQYKLVDTSAESLYKGILHFPHSADASTNRYCQLYAEADYILQRYRFVVSDDTQVISHDVERIANLQKTLHKVNENLGNSVLALQSLKNVSLPILQKYYATLIETLHERNVTIESLDSVTENCGFYKDLLQKCYNVHQTPYTIEAQNAALGHTILLQHYLIHMGITSLVSNAMIYEKNKATQKLESYYASQKFLESMDAKLFCQRVARYYMKDEHAIY